MASETKLRLTQRVSFRVLIFATVFLTVLGWPVYALVTYRSVEKRGNYYEVDLKAMSDFSFNQENGKLTDIPQQWRDLDGKRVALEGEMASLNSAAAQVNDLQLCYSRARCCFSGKPLVQHFVDMHSPNGIDYVDSLVRVIGTLHVNVIREGEKVSHIYQLDVESVEAKS